MKDPLQSDSLEKDWIELWSNTVLSNIYYDLENV